MTQVYDLLDIIKGEFESSSYTNEVRFGDVSEVDLQKDTLFPLAHFWMDSATYDSRVLRFNVRIMLLDVVDENKHSPDSFAGKGNFHDILNTQYANANTFLSKFVDRRGALAEQKYVLVGEPRVEMLYEEFENKLAGWGIDMTVEVPNTFSGC